MTSSSLPSRADVVVIGGGAIGAAAAWHLSREPKVSVAVLEARAVGAGSTSRSAAAFRQQFSSHSHVQMSLYSRREYERFPETFGGDPVFLQQGYLFLYTDPQAAEAARGRVAWQQTAGVADAAYLGPRDVDALPGLEGVFAVDALAGATWCPTDGFLRPTEIASGYVEGARRRGVSVHVGARVTGFETKGGAVAAVKVGSHRIETRAVVLAAGWWSHHVAALADCPIPVTAVKRYLYVTPQFGRRRVEHFPLVVWNLGAYARPEANGLMMGWDERPEKPPGTERHPGPLQGAPTLEADQDEIEPGYGKGIDDYGMEVLAQLAEAMPWLADEGRIAHVACGYYEVTPDDRAIIAQDPRLRGLFHASGFSGHGIMHAPAAGLAVAELALGKDPTFPMEPFALAPLLEDRPRAEPERMVI